MGDHVYTSSSELSELSQEGFRMMIMIMLVIAGPVHKRIRTETADATEVPLALRCEGHSAMRNLSCCARDS